MKVQIIIVAQMKKIDNEDDLVVVDNNDRGDDFSFSFTMVIATATDVIRFNIYD